MNDQYLLILFYSASGSVKNLAHAIADGAEASGMPTKIRTVPRVSPNSKATEPEEPVEGEIYCTKEELQHCSGLAIGSPTRFGSMAAPMKHFLDSTGDLWAANALENKPGMAFTSTSSRGLLPRPWPETRKSSTMGLRVCCAGACRWGPWACSSTTSSHPRSTLLMVPGRMYRQP